VHSRQSPGVFAIALLTISVLAATAHGQFFDCTTISIAAPTGTTIVLYNLPNGQGSPLTAARSLAGVVDATITLTLTDQMCDAVVNHPASDMWLEKVVAAGTGNFVACLGGTTADANTDANGVTTWTAPLRAGGWSTSRTMVVVNGAAVGADVGLPLSHNSADINGDGTVNLADIPLFAADFASRANPLRSDLMFDGQVNLSDISRLAMGVGAACQ
jgi:hypothetical protein